MIKNIRDVPVVSLQLPANSSLKKTDNKSHSLFKNKVFAEVINTSINLESHGIWIDHGPYRIWSVGIKSSDARSLNFKFEQVKMHAGAQLYIYNRETNESLGP